MTTEVHDSSMPEVKSCGVLIVRGDPIESFLLMKHPTRWDLPKGHVDPGETEMECALRELVEETGIQAGDVAIDPNYRYETRYLVRDKHLGGREAQKTLVIFLGRLLRDVEIAVTEHDGFHWFPWNPPHQIQPQAIDPLLEHLANFVTSRS